MIIGQFNDSFQPITDGVASVTRNYAQGLGQLMGENGRSYVLTPSFPDFVDDESDYEVIRYRSMPLTLRDPYRIGLPKLDRGLKATTDAIAFDIVHTHCPFSAGRLALKVGREKNIPVVASFHTKYLEDLIPYFKSEKISRMYLKNLMKTYQQADAVWTVNESTIETLRDYGYEGPVHVVENGTDLVAAKPGKRRSNAAKRVISELQLDDDVPVLFFIGQHIWQKNLRLLCESLVYLKTKLKPIRKGAPAFRMFFIGGGDAAEELQDLIKTSGLEKEVTFLGIIRDREFVRGLYERADLVLFPSLYDTSALVLRETAAALCPLLLIDGSSIAEGIRDGDNGFLAPNDACAYADAIIRALADPKLRDAVALRAQQTMYRSWTTVVGEVYEEYEKIIARKKALN